MKPIKLAQWGSTIALLVLTTYTLVMGAWVIFKAPQKMGILVQQVTVLGLFIAPEKLAAFFGPVLKRKQENGK
jgi:hypothetical protein